jgi:hypothetical protein
MQALLLLTLSLVGSTLRGAPDPLTAPGGALRAAPALRPATPASRVVRIRAAADGGGGGGSFLASAAKAWTDFSAAVDEEMWDFMYGARDRQWNPDRRSEEERRTPFDISKSSLSWGGMRSDLEFSYYKSAALPEDEPAQNAVVREDVTSLSDDDLALLGLKAAVNAAVDSGEREITGRELAELCFAKYSRYHDIGLLTTSPFGKTYRQVAVNIYGPSLGFGAFKLTEAQYLDKLDSIAGALNEWQQAQFVREFFLEAVKPRRGLPSRPRADTAVTLRLNTSPTWGDVPQEKIDAYWQFL